MKKYLLFLFMVANAAAFSQDISGNWQGVLYQGTGGLSTYYPYSMQLIQTGTTITGSTKIKLANTNFYGTHSIASGTISANTFTFQTNLIAPSPAPPFSFWCNPRGDLVYNSTIEKMQGPWTALNNCPPGTIEVWRLKLTSDSIFCEGQPVTLAVTGQNIRWYRDSSLTNLLAAGNTYSPVINTTTRFYVTQTHYNTESPLLPIRVVIRPGTYSFITQSICEGDTFMGHTISGIYFDTLINSLGCDSIRKLTLTVNPGTYSSFTQTICEGASFMGYTANGVYIDTLMNSKGCDSIRTVNLTVKPRIRFTLNHTICEGDTFLGYYSAGLHYDTFTVANNCDSIRIVNLTITPLTRKKINKRICEGERYFAGGTYQITSGVYNDTIYSNPGCDSLIETTLTVSPLPKPELGPDKQICVGDSMLLHAGNYSDYLWSNGTTLPTLQTKGPGKIWVSVTDNYGCKGFDTVIVQQVNCKAIQIPNAFSPNGDGINDTWVIAGLQNTANCKVTIFNRWAQPVFNSISYNKPWDGMYNRKLLAVDTYYYIIYTNNRRYTGSVMLLR